MVYTFRANGIYLSTVRYIPHDSEVYSSRRRGIFLTTARYIPHDGEAYSLRQRGIFLTTARYIPRKAPRLYSLRKWPYTKRRSPTDELRQ